MGPCVRRDDKLIRHAYENSIRDTPALAPSLGDWFETQLTCWQASPQLQMAHPTPAFPSVAGADIGT
jgi:hypothetical protein